MMHSISRHTQRDENLFKEGILMPQLEWSHTSVKNLNPFHIYQMTDYVTLDLLYSRLVEFNHDNIPIPGLASRISWDDTSVYFYFDEGHSKTNLGRPITAELAAESLLRHFKITHAIHGSLKDFFCGTDQPDSCRGIEVVDGVLKLTPLLPHLIHPLLKVLESVDFAVIPEGNFNSDQSIRSHSETTGLYFIEKDDEDGAWQLRINTHHYRYRDSLPKKIDFLPIQFSSITKYVDEGKFPYLLGIFTMTQIYDHKYYERPEFNTRKSSMIYGRFLKFSQDFLKSSSPIERWKISQDIIRLRVFSFRELDKPLDHIIPLEGRTDLEQREVLKQIKTQAEQIPYPAGKKYSLIYPKDRITQELRDRIAAAGVPLELVPLDYSMSREDIKKAADIQYINADIVSHNLYTLMSFLINSGELPTFGRSSKEVLREFVLMTLEEQLHLVQKLQFQAMSEAYLIPVQQIGFFTLLQKPLEIVNTGGLQDVPYFWNITW